jgi:hypothetical protein
MYVISGRAHGCAWVRGRDGHSVALYCGPILRPSNTPIYPNAVVRSTATWWWCSTKHTPVYYRIEVMHICLPHWLLLSPHSVYPVGQASALRATGATMVVTTSRKTSWWERPDWRRVLQNTSDDDTRPAAAPVCIDAATWCINIRTTATATTAGERRSFSTRQRKKQQFLVNFFHICMHIATSYVCTTKHLSPAPVYMCVRMRGGHTDVLLSRSTVSGFDLVDFTKRQ